MEISVYPGRQSASVIGSITTGLSKTTDCFMAKPPYPIGRHKTVIDLAMGLGSFCIMNRVSDALLWYRYSALLRLSRVDGGKECGAVGNGVNKD